jgi:hypothetical protein
MSLSHESDPADDHIVRYLLGLLSNEGTERLDELTIANDEVAWRVRVLENDLVDAYVCGGLDAITRAYFEQHYVGLQASPRRREKVRFARSLLKGADAPGAPANTETGCASPKAPARGVAGRARPTRWRRVARGAFWRAVAA